MKKLIALDLGSDSTRAYMHNGGIVYNEKSVVAYTSDHKKVVAAGNAALAADSRLPGALKLIYPLRPDCKDLDALHELLRHIFDEIDMGGIFSKPAVVFTMPRGSSIEACGALCDAILHAGASEVACVDAPIAAAHGAGLDVEGSGAFMILLLGESVSEAAIICRGAVLSSDTISVTGGNFRRALAAYTKKKYHIACSETELVRAIREAGGIHPSAPQTTVRVTGKDILTGLPNTASLTTVNINEAFLPCASELIRSILALLAECPDEIADEIHRNGITLCGGSALIPGLSELIAELTGIRTSSANAPAECVVEGIGDMIEMEDYPFNFVKG
ncbi:MAG: rod shape-determining protein [Clostridia bacterium]|nr:rod shape-determining protein [Clostridia bacterium]